MTLLSKLKGKALVRPPKGKDDRDDKDDKDDKRKGTGRRKKYPSRQKTDFPVRVFRADAIMTSSSNEYQDI